MASSTIAYRRQTDGVLCPVIFIAADRERPARSRAAEAASARRRSRKLAEFAQLLA